MKNIFRLLAFISLLLSSSSYATQVYGELGHAQLENTTADPASISPEAGRVWFRSDLHQAKLNTGANTVVSGGNATISDTFVMINSTQNLSNKTITPFLQFATNTVQTITPAAGFVDFYAKSDGNFYFRNSNGVETKTLGTIYPPTIQTFISGSGTYTAPTSPSPFYIRVKMVGGGGGSGSAGTGGASGSTGGGNSSFGTSLLVANGGAAAVSTTGGIGGTASLGSGPVGLAFSGAAGQDGNGTSSANSGTSSGGNGGSSCFEGAGKGKYASNGGSAAVNSGSGAGGAGVSGVNNATSGGGGGAGGCVDAIIYNPLSSYAYTVGGGGTGETGNSYAQGVNGPAGIIVVYEYYQ